MTKETLIIESIHPGICSQFQRVSSWSSWWEASRLDAGWSRSWELCILIHRQQAESSRLGPAVGFWDLKSTLRDIHLQERLEMLQISPHPLDHTSKCIYFFSPPVCTGSWQPLLGKTLFTRHRENNPATRHPQAHPPSKRVSIFIYLANWWKEKAWCGERRPILDRKC